MFHAARRGDEELDAGRRRALKLSPILAPLEAYKDQVVVLSNLAHAMAGPQGPGDNGGDHTRCPAVFLNGVHPKRTDGADILAGTTIDQIAAARSARTRCCRRSNWRSRTTAAWSDRATSGSAAPT